MLAEALTRRLPFPGANLEEMAESARNNNISCLEDATGLCPPLFLALRKSLATKLDDRFQTIAEFRDAVMPHFSSEGPDT